MILKTISKISIFSLIGIIMNGWLAYIFLKLWLHPQASDVKLIYSLTILILFEFVLVHSGVFMSILGRSWKGWAGFIVFYGLFALAFNALVNGNQIIILYGAVVLNRMLPGILNREKTDKERGLMMSAVYALIYFGLLFPVFIGSSYIPHFGLNETFVKSADYLSIIQAGGDFAEMPHVFMCFGVLYYLILMLLEVNNEIHRINPKFENDEGKNDGKQKPGCGCSPWLMFVLAATMIAIGIYQHVDDARVENSDKTVTTGVVSRASSSTKSDKKTNAKITTYQVSVTFTAEEKEYTITQEYFSYPNIGDTLSVVYPPIRPEKAVVAGTEINREGGNIFIRIGIILIIVWTGLLVIGKMARKLTDKLRDEKNSGK